MVCTECEKKLTKIVGVDPYRNKTHNKPPPSGAIKKFVTEKNRLIGSDKKAKIVAAKCKLCKCLVHQVGSHYCSTCAYQKGICAMCGKRIYSTKGLRQSVV
ncbi:unnamed protein product [Caenorhabditis auriculariae]|uniref:Cysteine-rich PDZ-binding protein n=1 Tax=Caenorhabditis auriculariae TaxID=2777116 RepID=A0A8S1GNZ9_9PELO|nr:unnamed protein product [Caenorhabditis auriculariae]